MICNMAVLGPGEEGPKSTSTTVLWPGSRGHGQARHGGGVELGGVCVEEHQVADGPRDHGVVGERDLLGLLLTLRERTKRQRRLVRVDRHGDVQVERGRDDDGVGRELLVEPVLKVEVLAEHGLVGEVEVDHPRRVRGQDELDLTARVQRAARG